MAVLVKTLITVIMLAQTVKALSCLSCNKTSCVEPLNCKAGVVKDVCGCCYVCGKSINQRCGGPWDIHGKCAKGLKCVIDPQREQSSLLEHFMVGVCKTDKCDSKTCGFRENCKINRRGKAVCRCPRRCGKAKFPVCGLSNGKQYRNKCRLQREECLRKIEIGMLTGKCQKCMYRRKEFKFGEERPDGRPCEICVCHHGLWKCTINQDCFIHNLPRRSHELSCLVSSRDGKNNVLPCPTGYFCRVPPSNDLYESFIVGTCKPLKAKYVSTPSLFKIPRDGKNKIDKENNIVNDILSERRMPSESGYEVTEPFPELVTASSTIPTVAMENKRSQNGGLIKHVCLSKPDERECLHESTVRWYYNASNKSCVQFKYGGCAGNLNNFLSKEKCQEVCQSVYVATGSTWPAEEQHSPVHNVVQNKDALEDSSALLEMCHDMKSGMSYHNGEKWNVDSCTSCSCVSGRALCIAASCPIRCSNPVYLEGKCCPMCKDNEEDIIVDIEGTRCIDPQTELLYQSGESWSRNNCTKCICNEGEISCTSIVCGKTSCPNPFKKEGSCCPVCIEDEKPADVPPIESAIKSYCQDSSTGKRYQRGEGWNVDDCISCFCDGGNKVCHETKCPTLAKCENPVHIQGRCCPVCPKLFESACVYDDRQYFRGDFILLKDMCTLCKCKGNMWNCSKKYCHETDSATASSLKHNATKYIMKEGFIEDLNFENNEGVKRLMGDKEEEFIVEDPSTERRKNKKSFSHIYPPERKALVNKNMHIEMKRKKSEENRKDNEQRFLHSLFKYNKKSSRDVKESGEKRKSKLPWFHNFDNKMLSSWHKPDFIEHNLKEKKKPVEVFGFQNRL